MRQRTARHDDARRRVCRVAPERRPPLFVASSLRRYFVIDSRRHVTEAIHAHLRRRRTFGGPR
ncbi:hypothetical protein WS73_25775 [Burkholderia savannae]|nr:hypothetical protein WS73_25775 [Burkholderia savannae]